MFLPKWVRECVAFVGERTQGKFAPFGTAFFVTTPATDTEEASVYVVTAAHNIFEKKSGHPRRAWVRVNYGNESEEVVIEAQEWERHPKADVAAAQWQDPAGRESTWIPTKEFANQEIVDYYPMGLGHDAYMIGLFQRHTGSKLNEVMCRRGSIAMMPTEPVTIDKQGNTADVYLMEVRSIGGFSGSPVFVHVPEFTASKPPPPTYNAYDFYLLGLASGHWDIPMVSKGVVQKDSAKRRALPKERDIATGISTIVPAIKIQELLERREFVDARKAQKRIMLAANAPTLDRLELPESEPESEGRGERLKLEGPFEDRIRDSFKAKKPPKRPKR